MDLDAPSGDVDLDAPSADTDAGDAGAAESGAGAGLGLTAVGAGAGADAATPTADIDAATPSADTGTDTPGPAAAPFGPGSAKPLADGAAPSDEYTVKGNEDSMLASNTEAPVDATPSDAQLGTDVDEPDTGRIPVQSADATAPAVPEPAPAVPEPAAVAPEPEPAAVPAAATPFGPGSATPLADGGAPSDDYTVKGNADSMLFHTTESPYYPRTKAEVWFKTAADAEAAGFTA